MSKTTPLRTLVNMFRDNPLARLELSIAQRSMAYWFAMLVFLLVGLAVGLIVISTEAGGLSLRNDTIPINLLPTLGARIYWSLYALQAVILLPLIFATPGGSIYKERQFKTWHMVFMSRMTAPEIVFGKLAAILVPIFVFLAATLPVYSICLLFGGITLGQIVLNHLAMTAGAILLSAIYLFLSAVRKVRARGRGGISIIFTILLIWFIVVPIVSSVIQFVFFSRLGAQVTLLSSVPFFGGTIPTWAWLLPIWLYLTLAILNATTVRLHHPAALPSLWPRAFFILGVVGLQTLILGYQFKGGPNSNDALIHMSLIWSLVVCIAPPLLFGMGRYDFSRLGETPRWDQWVGKQPFLSLPIRWLYPSHTGGLVTALALLGITLLPIGLLMRHLKVTADTQAALHWLLLASGIFLVAYWSVGGIIGSLVHNRQQIRANLALMVLIPGLVFASPLLTVLWKMAIGQWNSARFIVDPIWGATPPSAFWIAAQNGRFEPIHECCMLFGVVALITLPIQFLRRRKIYSESVIHPIDG